MKRALALLPLLFSIACSTEIPPPPAPPRLGDIPSLVSVREVQLRGAKQPATAIRVNDAEVVLLDEATTFSVLVALDEGANTLAVTAVDGSGRASTPVTVLVEADTEAPAPPSLDPLLERTAVDRVTVSGAKRAGDDILLNGALLEDALNDTTFSAEVRLAPGQNRIRAATRDKAGNESDVVEAIVEFVEDIAFTIDALPALVSNSTFVVSGTRGPGVELIVDDLPPLAANDVGGAWQIDTTLAEGDNVINVTGQLEGEPATAVELVVAVKLDSLTPVLVVNAPIAGALVDGAFSVNGNVSDADPAVTVSVCAEACDVDTNFVDVTLVNGSFAHTLDAGTFAAPDGELLDVHVRASDSAGNTVEVTRAILLARAAVAAGAAAAIDVAAGAAPYDVDIARVAGDDLFVAQDDGAPFAPADTPVNGANTVASAPAIVRDAGVVHLAWLEESTPGQAAARYAVVDGALDVETIAQGDVVPVTSVDLALVATGPVAAFAQGDEVLISKRIAGVWQPPIVVSDAVTASPSDVKLAAAADGDVFVIWRETTARDGSADDADVVGRRLTAGDVVIGQPLLISDDNNASAPAIAALGNDVAVGFIDGATAVVALLDDADFVTAAPAPDAVSAAGATSIALAASGGALAVLFHDGGIKLRVGLPGALSVPAVLAAAVAPTPLSIASSGNLVHAAWIEDGQAVLIPVEQ